MCDADDGNRGARLAALQQVVLSGATSKINTANVIAKEISDLVFQPRVVGDNRMSVLVQYRDTCFMLEWDDFCRRVDQAKVFVENNRKGENPFRVGGCVLIGETNLWLQSLENMMENVTDCTVLSVNGNAIGKVSAQLSPLDANGKEGPWDDDDENDPFVEDTTELLGTTIGFKVRINSCVISNTNLYKTISFEYHLSGEEFSTGEVPMEHNSSPTPIAINYEQIHTISVDEEFIESLSGSIRFHVRCSLVPPEDFDLDCSC